MVNLLIVGYCNLDDGFLYASNALKKLNYDIFFFAYHNHIMNRNNNVDMLLIKFIRTNNIDIILWWYNNIKFNTINIIKNTFKVKNIFFNWDPFLYDYNKYNALNWKPTIDERLKYYPLMDKVFSCFEKEITFCKDICNISYNPPGFDPTISKYEYDKDYECDISIVCTNLYDNLSQFPDEATNITRYSIVYKLYELRNKLKFHIYGLEKFKNLFPECYKGFISYKNCNKVFSNSKINLSIHPLVNELNSYTSSEEYFSERVPQILGCKGLLMTNSNLTSFLTKDEDYIYIDNEQNIIDKLFYIINNNNSYNSIRENGYKKALNHYKWDNWALNINNYLVEKKQKIIIISVNINWVYRLYEEYLQSIKEFLNNNYKNIEIDIIYFDKVSFEENMLNNINFNSYDKILYSGDLEILKLLVIKNNDNYDKIFFINFEQMSNEYYYKMIRTIDTRLNIIDYSEENIPYFKNIYNNIFLIPPYFRNNNITEYKDIDILSLKNNDYRTSILNNIKESIEKNISNLNILFFDNIYGITRNDLYKKSKVYLNIHCSDNHKNMEMIRIVNLVMNKVIIISQKSIITELLFLKDYIMICNTDEQIYDYSVEILRNYDFYFNKIYGNFNDNNYLSYLKSNFDNFLMR